MNVWGLISYETAAALGKFATMCKFISVWLVPEEKKSVSIPHASWVIDLDIKGFFDNIDHGRLMMAVEKHVSENWVRLYKK